MNENTTEQTSLILSTKNGLKNLIQEFLLSLDLKQNSKKTYERQMRRFVQWVLKTKLSNPDREDILAYKEYLESQHLSSLTISGYIVVIRRFFEYLESIKFYPNIARGIKGMKRSKGFRKDPLTLRQIQLLLNGIKKDTPQGIRDYAIINLLIRTGLRTIEIVRTNIGDIRQESGEEVLWIQGKGRDTKDEFVLLTEETAIPINEYLKKRDRKTKKENDPLFMSHSDRNFGKRLTTRSISRIVKDNLRLVGIDSSRITAHSLRHTAITLALQAGASIQEAQALGRHANINTTMIYAHNINRITHAPERKIDKLLDDYKNKEGKE
jgi:integrase/recombinase XerC/integrase/recombinase XerD